MSNSRKKEHLDIVLKEKVSAEYNYWDDIQLIHQALPEIDLEDIDTSIRLFGKELKAPIIISSMTGGFEEARTINENLGRAAGEVGVGMGVGSQRPVFEREGMESSYTVVKGHNIPLVMANIGAPQLIPQRGGEVFGLEEARKAMEMIDADILLIHLNYLQEIVQPEGQTHARGCLKAIRKIAISLPVVAKETGAGISREVALELKNCMVKGIDVGGLSGTSFSAVEYHRARVENDKRKERLGQTFWNWGIPTPASVVLANVGLPVIATGGIRNGLDVARALVLGASSAGIATQLLKAAKESYQAVVEELKVIVDELKATMFLTGSTSIESLKTKNCVIQRPTADWLSGFGLV